MAKKLKSFQFPGRGGGIYPWDEWLNGDIWELTPGVDFLSSTRSVRANASSQAQARGGKVRTSITPSDTLVIQFYQDGS